MSDLVERVARSLDPRAWESGVPLLSQRRRQDRARNKAAAAIAAVRAFDVEQGPVTEEAEAAILVTWRHDPEILNSWDVRGPLTRDMTAALKAAAKVRAEEEAE